MKISDHLLAGGLLIVAATLAIMAGHQFNAASMMDVNHPIAARWLFVGGVFFTLQSCVFFILAFLLFRPTNKDNNRDSHT
jgi:hypothetical protein